MLSKWCRELARGEDCALTAHGANRLAALVAAHHAALGPALPVRSGTSSIDSQ